MSFKNVTQKQMGAAALAVFLLLALTFLFVGGRSDDRDRQAISLPAMGTLISLEDAMRENSNLRKQVKILFSYDAAYLFVNYRTVNASVADIMFLWAGLTPQMVKRSGGQDASEVFLRRVFALPDDEYIDNNPLLGERPWVRMFNETKARLLMQGNGRDLYDGVAYYDPRENEMVIDAVLSRRFIESFNQFVEKQPQQDQRRYRNNMLSFIDLTKGLKNLNADEKVLLNFRGQK